MSIHETHLPTEQNQASKNLRLSQKNVHEERPTSDQPTQTPRTQTPDNGVNFPKSARVLYKRQFQKIMRTGAKAPGSHIVIHYRAHTFSRPRLGITVSKKHGKAHDRNRFKRVVREAFRQCQSRLPQDLEINVMPMSRELIDTPMIVKDFLEFAEHLKK
jgi:ribonuclease P protein component